MRRLTAWLCLLLLGQAAPAGAAFRLFFAPESPEPGQTLRVELNRIRPDQKMRARFLGRSVAFYPVGPDAQRALIGVPLGTEPGPYRLNVRRAGVKEAGQTVTITVSSRVYTLENVNFNARTAALMQHERRESRRIAQVKAYESIHQLWEGAFLSPVEGPEIGAFGLKRMRNRTIPAGFHKGVDLRAASGTPIRAASAGVVMLAANFRAHGKTVLLNHGQGVMSIYLHLSSISVRPGQKVAKGRTIGQVGSTGLSTAPHLHWQVYVHGVPVDPRQWLENEL